MLNGFFTLMRHFSPFEGNRFSWFHPITLRVSGKKYFTVR